MPSRFIAEEITIQYGMPCTKAALCGKAHRDNWETRKPVERKPKADRKKLNVIEIINRIRDRQRAERKAKEKAAKLEAKRAEEDRIRRSMYPQMMRFGSTTEKTCMYVLTDTTDGANTIMCGNDVIPGKPYCLHHCRVCFSPRRDA